MGLDAVAVGAVCLAVLAVVGWRSEARARASAEDAHRAALAALAASRERSASIASDLAAARPAASYAHAQTARLLVRADEAVTDAHRALRLAGLDELEEAGRLRELSRLLAAERGCVGE